MANEKVPNFKKNIEFTDDGRLIILDARLAMKIAEYFSKNGNLMVEIMSWGQLGVRYKETGECKKLAYTFSATEQGDDSSNPPDDKNMGCNCDVDVNLGCPVSDPPGGRTP